MSNTNTNNVVSIASSDIKEVVKSHEKRLNWMLNKFGHRRGLTTALFMSLPGAGKSETGRALSDELGRIYFEDRCGNLMPGDIRIPGVDVEKAVAKYCANTAYPFVETGVVSADDKVLLVWDEFLDASPVIQKIVKQGTNDNCIGGFNFPDNTLQIAFANGLDHGCYSEALAASNANRMAFYDVLPDVAGFQAWLADADISIEAEALVAANIDMFYKVDMKKWDGRSNFASFRTVTEMAMIFESEWTTYSGGDDPRFREQDSKRTFTYKDDPLALAKLTGILGESSAAKAIAWLDLYDAVGNIQDLIDNPQGHPLPDDLNKKWIIATKLVGEATNENLPAIMAVGERLTGQRGFLEAYIARSICKHKPSLKSRPEIVKWMKRDVAELCGR